MAEIFRGDGARFSGTAKYSDGSIINITGATVYLVAQMPGSTVPLFSVSCDVDDGAAGTWSVTLTADQNGSVGVGAEVELAITLASGRPVTCRHQNLNIKQDFKQ